MLKNWPPASKCVFEALFFAKTDHPYSSLALRLIVEQMSTEPRVANGTVDLLPRTATLYYRLCIYVSLYLSKYI